MTTMKTLAVERFGEVFELQAGEALRPGDRVINKGNEVATVGTVSKLPEHPSLVATLKPGQSVRVTDVGRPDEPALGLEAGDETTSVIQASPELAAAADFAVNPEVELLEDAQGLFGAAPAFLGAGGLAAAAAAGAIGLAALGGGDSGSDNDRPGTGSGNAQGSADPVGGLAGGLNQLNDALEQTPLSPLTTVTGALSDGLKTVGQTLSDAADPTGLAATVGELLGASGNANTVNTTGTSDGADGLVGLVNTVTTSLDNAVSTGPLEPLSPLIDPVSQLLGSTSGQIDGVAQGLANVGSSLLGDTSVLAPLTSDLLGPIVGTSQGQEGGLPQTLTQVGEGLTDLTNPDSVLAPLNALTDPLNDAVLTQLASGIQTIGDGLASVASQDPSGIAGLLADTLGGTVTTADAGLTNPLAGLTGLLGNIPGADALSGGLPGGDLLGSGLLGGGLLGGDLLGGLVPGTDALGGSPLSGATDLLASDGALSGISTGAGGVPGLDTLTALLPF